MASLSIIHPNGKTLTFDTSFEESYSPELLVADHPMEKGINVTDNIQKLAEIFTIPAMVTETPWENMPGPRGAERIEAAKDFLRSCEEQPLTIGTSRGRIVDCAIVRWPYVQDNSGKVRFDITFKQLRFAYAELIPIPKPIGRVASGTTKKQQFTNDQLAALSIAKARVLAAIAQAKYDQENSSWLKRWWGG